MIYLDCFTVDVDIEDKACRRAQLREFGKKTFCVSISVPLRPRKLQRRQRIVYQPLQATADQEVLGD
jgi:hypothetical protein